MTRLIDKYHNYLNARASYVKGKLGPVGLKVAFEDLVKAVTDDHEEVQKSISPPSPLEAHASAWTKPREAQALAAASGGGPSQVPISDLGSRSSPRAKRKNAAAPRMRRKRKPKS